MLLAKEKIDREIWTRGEIEFGSNLSNVSLNDLGWDERAAVVLTRKSERNAVNPDAIQYRPSV